MANNDNQPPSLPAFRAATEPGRWESTSVHDYKTEGAAPYKDVTRQVLFTDPAMAAEWRYFEVAPGGHTTLERHEHVHAVMVHRGHGRCLVGSEIREIGFGDLVFIPSLTWHQFRAADDAPLGFLCLVNAERDRPQLPGADDLTGLRGHANIADFIRT